jgi:isochorismate pyruvate lyase
MTSPKPPYKTCATMDEIRVEIDRVDRLLVPLLAERLDYVRQAAAHKPDRAQVVVPWRIEDVVAKAKALAEDLDTDSDVIERIYRALVDASIAWEGGHYDRTRNK